MKNSLGKDDVCLILGDNVFMAVVYQQNLKRAVNDVKKKIAKIFGYFVNDPERYGVVSFDNNGKAISLEEKPKKPKSNYAISGLYFYPNGVIDIAKNQKPSKRGELEITDTNLIFLKNKKISC